MRSCALDESSLSIESVNEIFSWITPALCGEICYSLCGDFFAAAAQLLMEVCDCE